MSGYSGHVRERAGELRDTFDHAFALAPNTETVVAEDLLAISVGSRRYALRLAEVAGLFVDKKITWLPSPVSGLLGIAGLRGTVLPVYDLGILLGGARAAAPRWLLVTTPTPIGLAFEGFDGYMGVRPEAIVQEVQAEAQERHVREVVQAVGLVRPLISLASVLDSIRKRASPDSPERSDKP